MTNDTYFAVPEKVKQEDLNFEIDFISQNALVSGLLHSISGVLAIVNEKRQVVAFNASFMKMLGIDDPEMHLGLRPGKILHCVQADKGPAGCGTSKQCRTCGAAVAMVTSLAENKPVERVCAIQTIRGTKEVDIALSVRAQPIDINQSRFLLLFLQDITRQQQQAALERTFFHDVNNLMSVLLGASDMLVSETRSDLALTVNKAAMRMQKEISIQRYLSEGDASNYTPMWSDTSHIEIFNEIESFFANHPEAQGKILEIDKSESYPVIRTDISLVLRIICNMVTNGFEAVQKQQTVKVWMERKEQHLSFKVWNDGVIAEDIRDRVFQRNFSTKEQSGRGIGTFSMKLLGEKILGGKVDFITSAETGTTFSLTLPT
jgi:signal transduction histidine kinase